MPSSIGLPLSSSLPGPTEITLPLVGFSLAESGSTMPLLVFSSASDCFTITRSARGRSLVAILSFPLFIFRHLRHSRGPSGRTSASPRLLLHRFYCGDVQERNHRPIVRNSLP